MANEDKANKRQEDLTNDFRTLEKSDIQIRNDIKHNVSKIHKAKEAIAEIETKKKKLVEENSHNEQILPSKIKELSDLAVFRVEKEKEFEKLEMEVRERTEKLRKDKETMESELNPLINQFNQIKNNIEIKK